MSRKTSLILGPLLLVALSFIANAAVFVVTYNRLATPFLHEEQRVENASVIITQVAAAYASVSVVIGICAYILLRRAIAR